jgi:hypothetical protein
MINGIYYITDENRCNKAILPDLIPFKKMARLKKLVSTLFMSIKAWVNDAQAEKNKQMLGSQRKRS